MNVLFTGHRGFLGKELIPRLSEFFTIKIYEGDLLNQQELEEYFKQHSIDYIVHSAARGGRRTRLDTDLTYTNNVESFLNVSSLGVPTISFCSGAIFGKNRSIDGLSEEDVVRSNPTDPYGKSKRKIWEYAHEMNHITLLRFFNVFGTFEDSSRFMRTNILNSLNNNPLTVFQDFYMDFFYVEDAFCVVKEIIQNNIQIKDLNLVYDQKYSLVELCKLIIDISKSKSSIKIYSKTPGLNYYGDGSRLKGLGIKLKGLELGIEEFRQFLA